MTINDIKINSLVRYVLVRHWVDVQKIDYGSFKGVVRLRGELCYLGWKASEALDEVRVGVIENEIRRIPEVKRVLLDFNNWKKNDRGKWVHSSAKGTKKPLSSGAA